MAQTIRSRIEAAGKRLGRHKQEQVMRFADQLGQAERLQLLSEVDGLDLDLLDELIERYVLQKAQIALPDEILPAAVYPATAGPGEEDKYQRALTRGEQLIAAHKVAAFTVAGGQGTRLNFSGPKGNVPATALRNRTLFQVFGEAIRAVQRRFNCEVPWYIMTSQANHEQTVKTFQSHQYFGLKAENVMHFEQGAMPAVDGAGKILLSGPGRLALSPDGHGGSLRALHKSGALADMAQRGIEYISYFQVDNPVVSVVDPLFIGLHALDNAEMSSKAVRKCGPLEKVGNFASVDGKVTVIEYSDLPDELAAKKTDDGRLMFEYGSIAIHVINRSFVERLNKHGFSLPWHRADKRVPYVDDEGKLVEPAEPNAVKLETFVFDALPLAEHSVVLEVERGEQFAPIKNASGADSIQSSQQIQIERAARWMEQAGVKVPRKADGSPDILIEISPLFALDAAEMIQKRRQLRPLKPGDIVYLG